MTLPIRGQLVKDIELVALAFGAGANQRKTMEREKLIQPRSVEIDRPWLVRNVNFEPLRPPKTARDFSKQP